MAQLIIKSCGIYKALRNISVGRFVRPYGVSATPPPPANNEAFEEIVDFDDSRMLPIPTYTMKQNESLEIKKARLLYQSRKRGMLENGLLLSTFAAKYLKGLNPQQTDLYDKLINLPSNDWDIFYWATEVKPTPEEYDNEIMSMFKAHVKNSTKETRYCQPDI